MCILSIVYLMPLSSGCVITILVYIVKACKYLRLSCTSVAASESLRTDVKSNVLLNEIVALEDLVIMKL